MNKIQALVRDVKERMKDIDIHFLVIQSDRKFMKRYLDLVAEHGDLRVVNSQIAKCAASKVKGIKRNDMPLSSLVQSFSELH